MTKKTAGKGLKEAYKNARLSTKIALAVGFILSIMLIFLIAVSIIMASSALTKSIDSEIEGVATESGLQVQMVVDIADRAVQDLQNYIVTQYDIFQTSGYDGTRKESQVYNGIVLERLNAVIEDYILNTAWSTVNGSDYIVGMGVLFEPDSFDDAVEDYTIYVGTEQAQNKTGVSQGAYSEYGSEDYYKLAASSREPVYTEPYVFNDITMITAAYPVLYNGELQGVALVDIMVDRFSQINMRNPNYPSLYGNIINSDGIYIYDDAGVEWSGQDMAPYFAVKSEYDAMMAKMQGDDIFKQITTREDGRKVVRYCVPLQVAGSTWWAQSILDYSDMNKDVTKLTVILILTSLACLVILLAIVVFLIHRQLKPIGGVVSAAEQLALGNFDIEIKAESNDEIGQLTQAFSATINKLKAVIEDLSLSMNEMAGGNFDYHTEVEYPGSLKEIETAMKSFTYKICDTLNQINMSSDQVAGNAAQIASGAQSLTDGATDQASSIEELQATVTDVASEVDRNARNAENANAMAREVGMEIHQSNEQMQDLVRAMNMITESSKQINNIINTIHDIATQTNLLSLNASIEAARAGEMGRGFAVVAAEVGNLAAQSAQAAQSSTTLIADAIRAVENGKSLVDETALKLGESAGKTQELVAGIGDISEASVRQAGALDQIAQAVDQIAAVVEENTAMAQESSASSEEMSGQAQLLKDLISQFKLKQ